MDLIRVPAPELRWLAQSQQPEQLQEQSGCGTMEGSLRVNSFRQGKVDFPFAFFWAIQLLNYTIQVVSETVSTMCLLNDGDKHKEVWLESTFLEKGYASIPFHSAFGDLSEQKGKPGLEVPVW